MGSWARTGVKAGLWGLAAWKLLAPEPVPRFSDRQVPPLEAPGHTVHVDGIELLVRELGPGDAPPMVLVHGWGDDSMVVFPRIAPGLAEDFRVVMVDNRNNGKSDHVRGGHTIEDLAEELDGVLDHLGVADATVFGFSMGGLVAQQLARVHPDRVARLALSGTAAVVPPLATWPRPLVEVGIAVLRGLDRVSRSELSWLRTRYLVEVGALEPEHAQWAWAAYQGRDPELHWASAAAIADFDSRGWVGELDVPTMVLVTARDQLMAPAAQRALVAHLQDAEVHTIDGRHEAPLTHADTYVRHLRDFASP